MQEFTQPVGPACSLPATILGVFKLFFTAAVIEYIVNETNRYARECMGDDTFAKWVPVTAAEIEAYLGFMILMGINRLPPLRDYWRCDPAYHYGPVADHIPRDRFFEISRYLHFVDNTEILPRSHPNFDRLWKVRPIINMVSETFLNNYNPHMQNAVDEAMIPFKGRSSLKQYMPKKPVKRGFKVWVRADSLNGYICQFAVYVGKEGERVEVGLGQKVVEKLTRELVGGQYHIYYDNFFTGVELAQNLLADGIYSCGTIRSNRKNIPEDLKPHIKKGLKERGDYNVRQDGNLVFTIWQDTKIVSMLSMNSQPTAQHNVLRRKKDGSRVDVPCPDAIVQYNKYMGGVDRNDQLRKYYGVRLKSRKSYKYIFWFILDVAITNAFILLSNYSPIVAKLRSWKEFRAELVMSLIGDYNSRKVPGRRPSLPAPRSTNLTHFPLKMEKRSRCSYCNASKIAKYTYWKCNDCNKYLCHTGNLRTDCFLKHHKSVV